MDGSQSKKKIIPAHEKDFDRRNVSEELLKNMDRATTESQYDPNPMEAPDQRQPQSSTYGQQSTSWNPLAGMFQSQPTEQSTVPPQMNFQGTKKAENDDDKSGEESNSEENMKDETPLEK